MSFGLVHSHIVEISSIALEPLITRTHLCLSLSLLDFSKLFPYFAHSLRIVSRIKFLLLLQVPFTISRAN